MMEKTGFIHTPANGEELEKRIKGLSGSEQSTATLYAGMAWNLACDIVNSKKTIRPPEQLNGFDVLAYAPYEGETVRDLHSKPGGEVKDFVIMVFMPENTVTPFCVAHWAPSSGNNWNIGNYCANYEHALTRFISRAGGRHYVAKKARD